MLEQNENGIIMSGLRQELGVSSQVFNDAMQILDDSGKISIYIDDYALVIKYIVGEEKKKDN